MIKYIVVLYCLSLAAIANTSCAQTELLASAPHIRFKIIAERSHKTQLFTQGLEVKNGNFYESSGLYSQSKIVSYPIAEPVSAWSKMTAPFIKSTSIPDRFFAEGITLFNNKLYVLTWRENTVFVYDERNFLLLKNLNYEGEGWGLTNDGVHLIRSDGTNRIFFHNADNFSVERTIRVSFKQTAINNINELEYADGFIWANIWHDNKVIKINPSNGDVVGILDFSDIATGLKLNDAESVLNGIAYDADTKAFWITGKKWPKMFLVQLDTAISR